MSAPMTNDKALEAALLPCPFCGGDAKHYHRDEGSGWSNTDWVCCENDECGCGTCLHETADIAIAAWNRRAAPAVPDGWKLVPEEATEEMIAEGHRHIDWCRNDQNTHRPYHPSQRPGGVGSDCGEDVQDAYRAMLAAAPPPPVQQGEAFEDDAQRANRFFSGAPSSEERLREALEAILAEAERMTMTRRRRAIFEAARRALSHADGDTK